MVSKLRSSAGPQPGSLLSCTSEGGVPNATHKVQAKCSPSFLHPRGEKQAEKHKYGIPGIVQRSVGTMGQRRVKTPNVTKQDPMKPSWDGPFPIPSALAPVWSTCCCCWVTKWYLTLYDTMNWSLPGSSVHGIFQASILEFRSVQSLSHVRLFVTPWTAARQASLSITNS